MILSHPFTDVEVNGLYPEGFKEGSVHVQICSPLDHTDLLIEVQWKDLPEDVIKGAYRAMAIVGDFHLRHLPMVGYLSYGEGLFFVFKLDHRGTTIIISYTEIKFPGGK